MDFFANIRRLKKGPLEITCNKLNSNFFVAAKIDHALYF